MASLVEIQYDPYRPNVSILLNGKRPSDYSQLIQYSDEDLWKWADKIWGVLYEELNDDYGLVFVGRDCDAAILQKLCEKDPHCISFQKREFDVSESLQNRMKRLNQLIRRSGITAYRKTIIDAYFYIPTTFQALLEDIQAIDINNLFCSVRVQALGAKLAYDEAENSVLFLLAESLEQGCEYLKKVSTEKPAYVLILNGGTGVLQVTSRAWFFETSQQDLFGTLFECFLQMPLVFAFRNCAQSIHEGGRVAKELERITTTVPIVDVKIDREVEVDKSIRLSFSTDPPMEKLPNLVCKMQNNEIASCDGFNVYGLKEGVSTLEVYREGAGKPFFTKEIRVIKRNRITKLVLSEDTLLLGEGDQKRIELDYFPVDADNAGSIRWTSSNESVLSVDNGGYIKAKMKGECRVICTAENVSVQCMCTVKPYMSNLMIQTAPEDAVCMKPMQEIKLDYECEPRDCIDRKLYIESSDYDIVNVVNETLYAKKPGRAQVTIHNESGRISRTLEVSVIDNEKPKKKVSFFQKLFS